MVKEWNFILYRAGDEDGPSQEKSCSRKKNIATVFSMVLYKGLKALP